MTTPAKRTTTLQALDDATRRLVRTAAVIAAGDELAIRQALADTVAAVRREWVEELILQSYLFCGFPRSLNAMREWRRLTGERASLQAEPGDMEEWRRRGEETCRLVYGAMYERLRVNIRDLHPELDEWMIVEGYGKVLSRPGLDLARRELCIVAACVASKQDRQLHSHLHGTLNVGVAAQVVTEALDALVDEVPSSSIATARLLWRRVQSQTDASLRR
ncbi:MAG TPA: carboxymuconolactone decarboxylase family protein [Gemmatimonadaceae bacterium]|nr:carboxymuconolactone decarboxylase family protein [Gemmatimonadaceae bacterium]